MGIDQSYGITILPSAKSFADTVADFEKILRSAGLLIFAKIDFSRDAKNAGLSMLPTQMLIFGNPKAGTPVMEAAPSAALDLPLKILIAQQADGKVWVSYNAPEYLAERHGIPPELVKNMAGIRSLVQTALA